jgi:heme/copper-type cytochrome/quinol oxidase subunit 3
LHLFLLVFALSQVGGFVGAAFAAIPQAPAWFYALIILFLLFEIVIFTIWALRHFMPRVTRPTWPNASRRHSASTTIPLPQNKP